MSEEWREIKGLSKYRVSNYGRVKSLWFNKEKIKKQTATPKGYLITRLRGDDGKPRNWFTHVLVGLAFIDNPEKKPQINHKSGDKLDNAITNLEWCTNSENQKHAFAKGLSHRKTKKVKCRDCDMEFNGVIACADHFGGSKGSLSTQIKNGWRFFGHYFEYISGGIYDGTTTGS